MYIYHLQGSKVREFISTVFPSISTREDHLALSTAFSTEIGHFALPFKQQNRFYISFILLAFRKGYPKVTTGVCR